MDYLRGVIHGLYLPHKISDLFRMEVRWWQAALASLTAVAAVQLALHIRHKLFHGKQFLEARRREFLDGKVVLITGASSGLGKSLATACYQAGAKVILVARSLDKLSKLCQELVSMPKEGRSYYEPIYRHLDLAAPEQIEAIIKELFSLHGRIDVLINNAGQSHRGTVMSTKMEVHRKLMEVNYFGHLAATLPILSLMKGLKGDGDGQQLDIVCISSVQGRLAIPYRSAYAASKHAYQAFFDCARWELFAKLF